MNSIRHGLALLGRYNEVRWILLVIGVGAAYTGDKAIALGIVLLVGVAYLCYHYESRQS